MLFGVWIYHLFMQLLEIAHLLQVIFHLSCILTSTLLSVVWPPNSSCGNSTPMWLLQSKAHKIARFIHANSDLPNLGLHCCCAIDKIKSIRQWSNHILSICCPHSFIIIIIQRLFHPSEINFVSFSFPIALQSNTSFLPISSKTIIGVFSFFSQNLLLDAHNTSFMSCKDCCWPSMCITNHLDWHFLIP